MKKKISKKIICVFLALIMIIVLGVIVFIINNKPSIETIKDSVVMIETFNEDGTMIATGSGFCAYKNNYIVTNYHVIKGAKNIKIVDDDRKEYDINKIEIIHSDNDLAIISGDFSFQPIKIDDSDLKAGNMITAIGSPEGQLNIVSTGIVGNADDDYQITITAPISPGSSGGVLLNDKNEVVGVTYAKYNSIDAQNINYAINVKYLNEMYKTLISDYDFILPDKPFGDVTNLNSFTQKNINGIYYKVDSIDSFYNVTATKKIFENLLKEKDNSWYNEFMKLSEKEKYECVSILEDLQKESTNNDGSMKIIKMSELIDKLTADELAYKVAIEEYQYAILYEKASKTKDINELYNIINELPIKEGQKLILKYSMGYQDISIFNDNENNTIINYIFNEEFSEYARDAAAAVLKKMGYKVILDNGVYTTSWN